MARIETYPLDTAITPNDFVLGSDGDTLNATKNYKVSNLIEQIGSKYNLQSVDLIYTYNAVPSNEVGDGEISTNNYGDVVISSSGVTSVYVSKLTVFGQLVEEYIETVGNAGLVMMMVNLANYNNFNIFSIDSVADVDANTLELTVTSTVNNGSFASGQSIGLKVYTDAGSTVDLSGYVTLDTTQTITGAKTFSTAFTAATNSRIEGNLYAASLDITDNSLGTNNINIGDGSGFGGTNVSNRIYFTGGRLGWQTTGQGNVGAEIDNNNTDYRVYTLQDKSGTIAHLDDIPSGTVSETTGTWTPVLTDAGGGATYTVGTNNCEYVRHGNLVFVYFNIANITTTGTPSGALEITLPFNSANAFQPFVMGQLFYGTGGASPAPTEQIIPHATQSGNNICRLIEFPSTSNVGSVTFTSNGFLRFSGTYIITA